MTDYIIKGEAFKTLNATDRFLGADLLAVNASLRFENLGPDVLTWTCRTESITAGETIIPDVGQRVELWNAAGSARYFRGWVTQARSTNYGVQVVVEGPWQWLQKIDITSSLTSVSTDTRPTITFNEATVTSNITALLTRAIALNAPIAIGTIASTFTIPKLQLSMMTCADVLAELMRWVPDCVGWWDYNGSGTPTFNLSRRGGMSATSYAVGTSPLVDFDLTGRPDLVPARVEVKFIERTAAGLPEYKTQADGTAATGRVQVIGLSGKELDTFLPPDDYESYTATTANADDTLSGTRIRLLPMIPEVVASRTQFSGRPNATDVILANGETITLRTSTSGVGTRVYPQPALQFLNPETGIAISRVGKRFVSSAEPPEWASSVFANTEKVRIIGRIYKIVESTLLDINGQNGIDAPNIENWAVAFPWSSQLLLTGFYPSTTILGYPWARVYLYALDFELDTILTTSPNVLPLTIYKPQDYDYLAPPVSLATNLLAVQGFTPYDGSVRLQANSLGSLLNYLQYKINITGAHSGLSTAGALVRATTYDLASQSIDLEIGAPSRFNFSTLGGKVRQTPQTNITIN